MDSLNKIATLLIFPWFLNINYSTEVNRTENDISNNQSLSLLFANLSPPFEKIFP